MSKIAPTIITVKTASRGRWHATTVAHGHRAARELTEDRMSRKVWKAQLQLLTKVTKARLTARQAFMANMLGNVRQLLRDLPLDQPLIDHTDEEIIALVRKVFRKRRAKRDSLLNRSIGRRKRKR